MSRLSHYQSSGHFDHILARGVVDYCVQFCTFVMEIKAYNNCLKCIALFHRNVRNVALLIGPIPFFRTNQPSERRFSVRSKHMSNASFTDTRVEVRVRFTLT